MRIRCSALLASLLVTLTPWQAVGQSNLASLNQDLTAAVAAKNWDQALQLLDQMLPLASGAQATQLTRYRAEVFRLQQLDIPPTNPGSSAVPQGKLGEVAIKRRSAGVPVVDVRFNRRKRFEMLVDSGASLTVITRPMAKALGITPDQIIETITVSTANGTTQMPIVYVNAIEVGGLTISQVKVAIAGPDMDIGLLGQDFLERYDVLIQRDRIRFQPRARNR